LQLGVRLRERWREIAAYPVIASAGIAGGIRASWWWVVLIALVLSLMRWDSLAERAIEVSHERRRSGRQPWLVEAYVAVLAASFLLHFCLSALAYVFGRGLAWFLGEFMR
jgi:ABC-type Fe3+ transport system permease subunit